MLNKAHFSRLPELISELDSEIITLRKVHCFRYNWSDYDQTSLDSEMKKMQCIISLTGGGKLVPT